MVFVFITFLLLAACLIYREVTFLTRNRRGGLSYVILKVFILFVLEEVFVDRVCFDYHYLLLTVFLITLYNFAHPY